MDTNRLAKDRKEVNVRLLDATLRDGSYVTNFQFDRKFVKNLLNSLEKASVNLIEVGHGVGFEAERSGIRKCNISLSEWCDLANGELAETPWGMFAQPSFSRLSTLEKLCENGMNFVRIGMEAQKVEKNLSYLEEALSVCDNVYVNLMKSSVAPKDKLREYVHHIPKGIAGIYIVDSFGSMFPNDVVDYINALVEDFSVIGFHGHDNLGMANANSLAAISAGATVIDGTLYGIGRGSGNAMIEVLAGILTGHSKSTCDFRALAKLADYTKHNIEPDPENRYMQILGGGYRNAHFSLSCDRKSLR